MLITEAGNRDMAQAFRCYDFVPTDGYRRGHVVGRGGSQGAAARQRWPQAIQSHRRQISAATTVQINVAPALEAAFGIAAVGRALAATDDQTSFRVSATGWARAAPDSQTDAASHPAAVGPVDDIAPADAVRFASFDAALLGTSTGRIAAADSPTVGISSFAAATCVYASARQSAGTVVFGSFEDPDAANFQTRAEANSIGAGDRSPSNVEAGTSAGQVAANASSATDVQQTAGGKSRAAQVARDETAGHSPNRDETHNAKHGAEVGCKDAFRTKANRSQDDCVKNEDTCTKDDLAETDLHAETAARLDDRQQTVARR